MACNASGGDHTATAETAAPSVVSPGKAGTCGRGSGSFAAGNQGRGNRVPKARCIAHHASTGSRVNNTHSLTGTIRREFLDQTLFWNSVDLKRKLGAFQDYYNHNRFHASLDDDTPAQVCGESKTRQANLACYRWQTHCRGLVQLPMTA